MKLIDVTFDEIREGDRIVVSPPGKNRFGLVVDAVHYEHYGKPPFAIAGYRVRVGEPHHRFTERRVLRRRLALRSKIQRVVL